MNYPFILLHLIVISPPCFLRDVIEIRGQRVEIATITITLGKYLSFNLSPLINTLSPYVNPIILISSYEMKVSERNGSRSGGLQGVRGIKGLLYVILPSFFLGFTLILLPCGTFTTSQEKAGGWGSVKEGRIMKGEGLILPLILPCP